MSSINKQLGIHVGPQITATVWDGIAVLGQLNSLFRVLHKSLQFLQHT